MALTDRQKVDVRRYAGYTVVANQPVDDSLDVAYVSGLAQTTLVTLANRLDNMSSDEESALTEIYLDKLAILEAAIPDMSEDLDTDAAGTWKANPLELGQRTSLFNRWRRAMCNFIGVDPGPGLGEGGMRIIRT